MISATKFSYEHQRSLKWRSMKKSRFHTVAKLMDSSNLKIQIKLKTEVLSLDVVYAVHLVFKFCEPRKFANKWMYVNLKYKKGSETLHAYFAKQRDDDGWMMIELDRFLNKKQDTDFEVSLESFSRYYCGSGAIYVQGVEFLAIENKKQKEDKKLLEVQQVPTNTREIFEGFEGSYHEEKFLPIEVNGMNHLMLSAEEVLFNSDKLHCFQWKRSAESRFHVVAELLPRQVFRIKYKIKNRMLTPLTRYECYLVFKLSRTCCGLRCPVKVRDLLHRKNKELKFCILDPHPHQITMMIIGFHILGKMDGWMS